MAKKPLTETTRVTINIEGGPYTGARRSLISATIQAILTHGSLSAAVVEMDRNDEAAAITLETKEIVYDDDGNYLYEEETQGLTDANPAAVPEGERVTYRDAILQAMKPDESKTEPEPEQADDCDCPVCQLRRAYDKDNSDQEKPKRGPRSVFLSTPAGLIRLL